jgi:hypothetical protein
VTDAQGNVVEVGARSSATLAIFQDTIFGRDVTEPDLKRLYDANEKLIAAMREDPKCAEKLRAFNEKRGHREEWSDSAQLAYYDPDSFKLIPWAKRNGISLQDLYHAGFVDRTVTASKVEYRPLSKPVVFIPFKDDEGRLVLWRMRVIQPKRPGDPKYLSAPLVRSDRYPPSVHRELYQSELLKNIRGKPLIITEGEFKCLVTTQLTGIDTVGITGITQVTDNIIAKIVAAGPSKIFVILDRDPRGKSFDRTDALTDSERAAFSIAERLTRAGAQNVRVGTLPNQFEGDKCGIDDWLLDVYDKKGAQAPAEHLRAILKEALPARDWLTKRCGDSGPQGVPLERQEIHHRLQLQELLLRLQRVRQIKRDFTSHFERSGRYPLGSAERAAAQEHLDRVDGMLRMLDAARSRHLNDHFNGARRINQPPRKFLTLYPTGAIRDQERKCLVTHDGAVVPLDRCKQPILSLRATPPDLGSREKLDGAEGLAFPISMARLSKAFEQPRGNTEIARYFSRGTKILTNEQGETLWKDLKYRDFIQRVFAGWLAETYPPSDYRYERDVSIEKAHRTHRERIATVPITIFKDGETPIAFCFLPYWNCSDARDVQDPLIRQEAVRNLARQSSLRESWIRAAIRTSLRSPTLAAQRDRFDQISSALSDLYGQEGNQKAAEQLARFGIDESVAQESGAVFIARDQWHSLLVRLRRDKLINQGVQSGLLRDSSLGSAEPRFQSDVILISERDERGKCIAFSALPLTDTEYKRTSLPPIPKWVYTVDSIRSTTPAFDRSRMLFPDNATSTIKDKTVLIASSELECLQLRSVVRTTGRTDIVVLAVRELDSLARTEYEKLAKNHPKRVIFVGQAAENNKDGMRYASLALLDPDTHAAKYLRVQSQQGKNPPVSSVMLRERLALVLIEAGKDKEIAKEFLADLLKTPTFKSDPQITAKLEFSELLADVECAIALRGKEQELSFDVSEMIEVLRDLYDSACNGTQTLEEFLSDRYFLPAELTLQALERGIEKPVYRPGGRGITSQVPAPLREELRKVARSLEALSSRGSAPANSDFALVTLKASNTVSSRPTQEAQSTKATEQLCVRAAQTLGYPALTTRHDARHFLGRLVHRVSVSLPIAEPPITVTGTGSSKKSAEEKAWRAVDRTISALPTDNPFKGAYEDLSSRISSRLQLEEQMEQRGCIAYLNREIGSLKRQGFDITLSRGEQKKNPINAEWEVPYTLKFEDMEVKVAYPGSTPSASDNLAAARLLVYIREKLDEKRRRNEYNEPETVVQDLIELARVLDVPLNKPEPRKKEHKGEGPFSCRWSATVADEVIEVEASDLKKGPTKRLAAAQLLRELEKRDSVLRILDWE